MDAFSPVRLAVALAMLSLPHAAYPREDRLTVWVGENRFQVELATTPEAQQRGLMYRDSLAPDEGMLFIQPHQAPVGFWMKNMKFALDILYFDGRGRLLEVHSAVPPCPRSSSGPDDGCPLYESAQAIKYILELGTGTAMRYGIKPGDRLVLGQFGGPAH
ncbi:MAG: DUF192 domain-containing protein [Gammaproteobacteria bacterium]